MKKALIVILSALLIASCQVSETLNVRSSSSIESSTNIKTEDFFIEVLEDFGEFLPENDMSIMDSAMKGFSDQLDRSKNTERATLSIVGHNQYMVDFSTDNIIALIEELGGKAQSLFTSSKNSISFYVDIDNFEELTRIVPFLADPNFEVYGPLYNQGTSEEDYLDMIYYLLGEEGPDAIENGYVSIEIHTPSEITKVTGAQKKDNNTALFEFPIIDFLLLNKPLSFSISWK